MTKELCPPCRQFNYCQREAAEHSLSKSNSSEEMRTLFLDKEKNPLFKDCPKVLFEHNGELVSKTASVLSLDKKTNIANTHFETEIKNGLKERQTVEKKIKDREQARNGDGHKKHSDPQLPPQYMRPCFDEIMTRVKELNNPSKEDIVEITESCGQLFQITTGSELLSLAHYVRYAVSKMRSS